MSKPRKSITNMRRMVAVLLCVVLGLGATTLAATRPADAQGVSTTLQEVSQRIGATPLIEQGITGAGIDVAVIDTGVEPVAGLDGYDKLIVGPDLSFEAGVSELYGHDTYGHGTVMASIIAGDDEPGGFQGVAPGARIVSVKVADNTGAVDVSQVIAALDWVVDNGRSNGLNVRVINLSYVTDSEQSYDIDPLAYAVERAWKAGYVVVVAAGNAGYETKILGNPAADPYVIAVAAADGIGAADFSSRGSKTRMPDLLAPGDRILGLAAPNSRLVQEHPEAVIDGRFLRGSGTSQATAIVSGAAALLLEQRPELTPDQVKALLILGVVDEKGHGRASENDATKGMTEFFDLLDLETEYRVEASSLLAEADELRNQAQGMAQEAALFGSEATTLFDESMELFRESKRLDGDEEKAVENQAKAVEDMAKDLEQEADDLTDMAEDLEKDARDLEKDAAELLRDADKARREAEHARVPDHVRERQIAEAEQRLSADLMAEVDLLRSRAMMIGDDADELYFRAEEMFAQAEDMADEQAAEEAAKELEKAAAALEKSAKELEKQADDAEDEAEKALADAIKANEKADKELRDLEHEITKIFENWDGKRLGGIDYDPQSGAGLIDLERSAALPAFDAVQYHFDSTGTGSLEASRGSNHVTLPDGSLLQGEVTFAGSTWTGSTWTGATWSGSTWTGSTWTGATWSGSTWTGATWSGSTWTGATWSGSTWTGSTWTGATWSGSTWTGSTWG